MSLSWLWDLLIRAGSALWDRWQSLQQAMARGRAEADLDAIRKAEAEEAEAQRAAEEAEKLPPMTDDGWMRPD